MVKLQGKPLDINFIQIYAPTSSTEEETETFHSALNNVVRECKMQEVTITTWVYKIKVHKNFSFKVCITSVGFQCSESENDLRFSPSH